MRYTAAVRAIALATWLVFIEGCVSTPTVPPPKPPPTINVTAPGSMAAPRLADASPAPPPAPASAPTSAASAPQPTAAAAPTTPSVPALSPERRRQAELASIATITRYVNSARGNREKLARLLEIPKGSTSATTNYLGKQVVSAMQDPLFIKQLVADMTDTQVQEIEKYPASAMTTAGATIGGGSIRGFYSLDIAQREELLTILGGVYNEASTTECTAILSKTHNQRFDQIPLIIVMDRLPGNMGHRFVDLTLESLRHPRQPLEPPLTEMQKTLVKLNVQQYLSGQTESVRNRFNQYYGNGPKVAADECWATSQLIFAILSGDDEARELGVRLFITGLAASGVGS